MKKVKLLTILSIFVLSACSSVYTENRAKTRQLEERAKIQQHREAFRYSQEGYQTDIRINQGYVNPYYNRGHHSYRLGQRYRNGHYQRNYGPSYYERQQRARERYQDNKQRSNQRLPRVNRTY